MRNKLLLTGTALLVGFGIFAGVYFYYLPSQMVNRYLTDFNSYSDNRTLYPNEISRFLSFHQVHSLPSPSVKLKIKDSAFNSREVLANFEIITYAGKKQVADVYYGMLAFSMVRDQLDWRIESVKVVREMGKAGR
ncbi:hypothetical protein ACFOQM_15155 [Paenibacillus sp. GCM10012307]|uniref:Uncharacterized protein n=1 Tax=Paenibacillus roseus TaxID=2798579 RepID=A0A934J6F6_9BACL|nr:hypothetical protein [Paenibacillus roseus]MBJ6362599.1 hypothetical protein [Paenibacillus roseus]